MKKSFVALTVALLALPFAAAAQTDSQLAQVARTNLLEQLQEIQQKIQLLRSQLSGTSTESNPIQNAIDAIQDSLDIASKAVKELPDNALTKSATGTAKSEEDKKKMMLGPNAAFDSILKNIENSDAPGKQIAGQRLACIQLARYLQAGATGEEVSRIQEFLAMKKDIYPEGIVSGFYGPLTARAIERFQASEGIEKTGTVGPITRGALQRLTCEKSEDNKKSESKKPDKPETVEKED